MPATLNALTRSSLTPEQQERNFVLGVIDGMLFRLWMVLTDVPVVLTWFVGSLTDSPLVVGLLQPIHDAGWMLPQLLVAGITQRMPHKMRMYRLTVVGRATCWAVAAALPFMIGPGNPTLLLTSFLAVYGAKCLLAGANTPAWSDIVAKSIPADRRGAFASWRDFGGGVAGIVVGVATRYVLDERRGLAFPYNFGVVFALALVPLVGAFLCFSQVKEAEEPPTTGRGLVDAAAVAAVWRDPNFVRFLAARVALQLTWAAVPFYAVYARTRLGAPTAMVSTYLSALTASAVASTLLWGRLCDRRGNRMVMLLTSLLTIVILLVPLGLGQSISYTVFTMVFVLQGIIQSATMIFRMTFVMDLAPAGQRPVYSGLANTVVGVVALAMIGAGGVVQVWGLEALFALCLVCACVAPFLVWGIRDPKAAKGRAR